MLIAVMQDTVTVFMMLQEYTVFFPLTRNTDVLNINAAAAAVANGSVTDAAYFTAPYDCDYNKPSAGMSAGWAFPCYHGCSGRVHSEISIWVGLFLPAPAAAQCP